MKIQLNTTRVTHTPDKNGHSNTRRNSKQHFYIAKGLDSNRFLVVRGTDLTNDLAVTYAYYFLSESMDVNACDGKDALAAVIFNNATIIDLDNKEEIL